jgi:hypothetical protein
MKTVSMFVLFLFLMITSGCNKDNSNPSSGNDQFSKKLTLGTGADYSKFLITGESSSFNRMGGFVQIYWRLESSADMGGSAVNILIEKQSRSSYVNDTTFTYSNPQNSGHIMISNFSFTKMGNFRATGILVNGNIIVASKEFTVQ